MIRALASACLAGVLCAGAAAAGAPSLERSAGPERVFRDGRGEEAAGPDIATVAVSSDTSTLTFRIAVPTNPVLREDMRLRVWLDADHDRATGLAVEGVEGFDHFVLVDPPRFGLDSAQLYSCHESTCSNPATSAAPTFGYANGASFGVDVSALGLRRIERIRFSTTVTAGIRYEPATRQYDLTNAHADTAPDSGTWTYDGRALRVASFRASPSQPRAGSPFMLSLRAIRTETGTRLRQADVSCSLRIGGRTIPARTRRFAEGRATCVFDVPPATRGQRFRSGIRIAFGAASVARSLSGRIG